MVDRDAFTPGAGVGRQPATASSVARLPTRSQVTRGSERPSAIATVQVSLWGQRGTEWERILLPPSELAQRLRLANLPRLLLTSPHPTYGGVRFSSSRAMERRWTASGPSTIRSTRAHA